MRPWSRACVTLLSSTNQLSVTASAAASLGLAASVACALGASVAAVVGAVVGEAPPKPPPHAVTASAASSPSAPIRVADVAMWSSSKRRQEIRAARRHASWTCSGPGRMPVTIPEPRPPGLSGIDVFLRGIAFR